MSAPNASRPKSGYALARVEAEQDLPIFTYRTHRSAAGQISRIHHCDTKQQWESALQHLLHENVLGFDCEWKPEDIYPGSILMPENCRNFDDLRGIPMVFGTGGVIWLPSASSRSNYPGELYRWPIMSQRGIGGTTVSLSVKPNNTTIDDHGHMMQMIKEKCSVVQLGSESHIVVAHIARFPTPGGKSDQLVPDILRHILGCSEIIKTGLEVLQDGNLCDSQLGVKVHGLRCLRSLHGSLSHEKFKGMCGLAAIYLEKGIQGKGDTSRQLSDWSSPTPLTQDQIDYAANDALISLLIHNEITTRIGALNASRTPMIISQEKPLSSVSPPFPSHHQTHQPTPPSLKSQKAKAAREKRHRSSFDSLSTDSRLLYGKLRARRDELMLKAGLTETWQSRFVADTETIFLLAREKPGSVAEVQGLGRRIQKAAREEFCEAFLEVVRGHVKRDGVGVGVV